MPSRWSDLYFHHFKISLFCKINGEPRGVGRASKGIVLSLTLISIRSYVFLKLTHSLAFVWQIFRFSFELKIKVPKGNYAMGNWHFNKLGSHILLIMVNLIIAINLGKPKKNHPFMLQWYIFLSIREISLWLESTSSKVINKSRSHSKLSLLKMPCKNLDDFLTIFMDWWTLTLQTNLKYNAWKH